MLKELGFYRGMNLGGWLSQCDYSAEHLDNFITEPDFAQIAAWGFDHVRIPVDYNVIQSPDGAMIEAGLERIDRALDFCNRYGLHAVVDLHKAVGFSFDEDEQESGFFENERYQELFYHLWESLASRYGRMHESVMFDLLNEVTDEAYLPAWKRISRECVRRIRSHAPRTLLLVGGCDWNSAAAVQKLDAPYDAFTVYSFHFYEPKAFTHQGAWWESEKRDTSLRFTYEESGASREYFEKLIAPAVGKAASEGCPLYCGEYGVIDVAAPEEALKWVRDLHAVFENHGISRCLWSYKEMDFGFSDERMDAVRGELLKYV